MAIDKSLKQHYNVPNTKKIKGTPLYSYLQKQGILKKDK